jgi:hypothetical protein
MIREISTPDFVESKYDVGSRSTCCSTDMRSDVIVPCAATPRICDSEKEVMAWISVAVIAAAARSGRRSAFPLPITSSMSTLDVAGSTSPERRLTSISSSPAPMRPRRAQISCRASRHASSSLIFTSGS